MAGHLDDWIAETAESITARLEGAEGGAATNAIHPRDDGGHLDDDADSVRHTKGITSRLRLAFARDFFFWFPVAASAFVFYLDRRSYFQPDPFAPGAAIPGVSAPLFFESMVVFFACWIPLLACCRGSAQYSKATDNVLRDDGQRLQSDLLRRESAGTPSPAAVTT